MEKETKQIILYLLIILIFLGGFNLLIPGRVPKHNEEISLPSLFLKTENSTIVSLRIPAVDKEGNGRIAVLTVEASNGSGRTLVDIDNLLFWLDTQQSIRMARLIAGNISNKNLSKFDLVYSIKANASTVGGPSAGAAITIATIFALNGEKPKDDVVITGSINHDGTIGPVDSILEKAQASKKANLSLILVPLLQGKEVFYEEKKYCHKFGFNEICTIEHIPKEIDVSKEVGIRVKEVRNILEALEYFK